MTEGSSTGTGTGTGTRTRLTTTAAVTAVLALGALGGSSAGAAAEDVRPTAATGKACVGKRQAEDAASSLNRMLSQVQRTGQGRYSDIYSGVVVSEDGGTADVYRVPSKASGSKASGSQASESKEFDAQLCAAAERGVTVRLHDTVMNAKDAKALADRIGKDMDRWKGTFRMQTVGPEPEGYVLVGVDDPVKARPILEKAFGKENLRVEQQEKPQLFTTR